jgi:hypothetical protein
LSPDPESGENYFGTSGEFYFGIDTEFRGQLEYRADVGGGLVEHEVVDVFVAQAAADLSPKPNPDEVMDTRWLSVAALNAEIAAHPDRHLDQDLPPRTHKSDLCIRCARVRYSRVRAAIDRKPEKAGYHPPADQPI